MNLTDLQIAAASCCLCDLHKNRKKPVFAKGENCFGLMIVGMVPGPEENEKGIPFVGSAGKLLDDLLSKLDISTKDVYITNTVKCALKPGIALKEQWIEACLPFLIAQITIIKPKVILSLGADATNTLLGLPLMTPISDLRGRAQKWLDQIYVIPTYHPSYLLRGGGRNHKDYNKVLKDFGFAVEIALTEYNKGRYEERR